MWLLSPRTAAIGGSAAAILSQRDNKTPSLGQFAGQRLRFRESVENLHEFVVRRECKIMRYKTSSFTCVTRLILWAVCLIFSRALGQTPGIWQSSGPSLGIPTVTGILTVSQRPYQIYVGTANKGVYQSTDAGLTWVQANPPMNDKTVNVLTSVEGRLYVGTGNSSGQAQSHGVFYSIDQGINWIQAYPPMNDKDVTSLISIDGTLLAGTAKNGVFYSSDRGINWTQANAPLNDKSVTCLIFADGTLLAGTVYNGVFYSTDHGINWTQANTPLDDKVVTSLISVNKTLYVGTANDGVFWSTDGGIDWSQSNPPMNDKLVQTMSSVNGVLYAGTGYSQGQAHGLYYTLDGGKNWTQANVLNDYSVTTIVGVNDTLYAGTNGGIFWSSDKGINWTLTSGVINGTITSIASTDGVLYACSALGVFRKTSFNRFWIDINQHLNANASVRGMITELDLIVTYGDGVFRSTDGGINWTHANFPIDDKVVTSAALGSETIWAGTSYKGLLFSLDGGVHWTAKTYPPNWYTVVSLRYENETFYAGTIDLETSNGSIRPQGLFFSKDGGKSWTQARSPMNNKFVTSLTSSDGIVCVGTGGPSQSFHQGVFYSHDDGATWKQSNPPMNDKAVSPLISVDGGIYAGTGDGVFYSIDQGINWIQANPPMNDKDVTSLISIDGTLLAGTSFSGVFYSIDKGINWTQANSPMDDKTVTTMFLHDKTIYLGTSNNGVFKSYDSGAHWFPLGLGIDKRRVNEFGYVALLNRLYAATEDGIYFQTLDTTPPTSISMNIDNGVAFTRQREIQLTLVASDADSMILAEQPTFHNAHWQNYQASASFKLSLGDGKKTVYARFKDISYNFSDTLRASIGLDTTPPAVPDSLDSRLVQGQPTQRILDWNKSRDVTSGLDRYRLYLSQSDKFSGATTIRDSIFATENLTYTTPRLADAGWYWRVTAVDRAGNESTSLPDSFVVNIGQAPAAPTIQLPSTITNDKTPTISWTSVEGAEAYHLQYASSSAFIDSLNVPDLRTTSYTFVEALADGRYYFRVYAKNASEIESVASPTAQLTIDTRPPESAAVDITTGTFFSRSAVITLRLSANNADSVRLLGDLADNELSRFKLFDLDNQIRTQITVTLSPGEGLKNLQAQFKDRAGNIANAFRSVFLDGQEPVFPTGTPQLSTAVPSLNQAVTVSLPPPTDANGSGLKSFNLLYRRSGEQWDNRNRKSFQNNLAEIPFLFVTNRGVDYQITAEDSAGNLSILSNGKQQFFSIPVSIRAGEAGGSPGLPGGTGGSAYRLISLPLVVENQSSSSVFTDLGVYGIDKDYRFWSYESSNSWREGSDIIIRPGKSYFLIRRKSGSISNKTAGTTVPTTDAALGNIVGWRLQANDWTLLGNPFNFEISLTDLRLKNRDTSLVFVPDVWSYDGGSLDSGWSKQNLRLSPWGGLAIYNSGTTDTLIFTAQASVGGSEATLPMVKVTDSETNPSGIQGQWTLRVRAESRGYQDNENYFGVRAGAQEGQDQFDLHEPPMVPDGVSLSFAASEHEQRSLASDMRPSTESGLDWRLQVLGTGGSEVALYFEGLATLPTASEVYLLDHGSQLLRDLRLQPEVRVYLPRASQTKILTLLVGDRAFVEDHSEGLQTVPTNFTLYQNYPNPFNPTTVIRYALPIAGKVTLKIYNLLGVPVEMLEEGESHGAGYYEKVVDLRNLASGIYFYRISVSGEQRYEATKKLMLTK